MIGVGMMAHTKRKLLAIAIPLLMLGVTPMSASADDNAKSFDGRLDDYGKNVTLDSGGTAFSYAIWGVLGLVGLGVLFKDAKRSHLD